MSICQTPAPCFEFRPVPWESDDDGLGSPHYETREAAERALDGYRGDCASEPESAAAFDAVEIAEALGCWIAVCDHPGGCNAELADDETGAAHFDAPEDVIACMAVNGWTHLAPGWAFCPAHPPEDADGDAAQSGAELEAAGLLAPLPVMIP